MSYQVLARKWRPHRFEEMVGQRHVLQALTNALESDRLHHAYLFTGTRGVGKTTIARIFAKSLNCEQGVSATPCGECSACLEIDQGRFVDLIEVDAASRTGVDDTRDLLDNVQYAATRGRYKVYLIDEVHMFSRSSFNALLKTLEEPPPHIKFLLATTDPKKIPPTILSRCLQFNLKRLMPEQIEQQLTHILKQEDITTDERSLEMIAFAADGSVRDALSLLDQAISFCGGELKADEVAAMLGTIDKDQVLGLVELLASKNAAAVLEKIAQMDELGPDYQVVLAELLVQLQAVAVEQLVPGSRAEHRDHERISDIAALLSSEETQLYYQIALIGQRDMAYHPDPRGGFEMVLLRMLAFERSIVEAEGSGKKKSVVSGKVKNQPQRHEEQVISPLEAVTDPQAAEPALEEAENINTLANIEDLNNEHQINTQENDPEQEGTHHPNDDIQQLGPVSRNNWHQIVGSLGLDGLSLQLAISCAFDKHEDNEFYLSMSPGTMCTDRIKSQLEQALRSQYGECLVVIIEEKDLSGQETPRAKQTREEQLRLDEAKRVIKSDPDVQKICEAFDATIIEDSIQPVNRTK